MPTIISFRDAEIQVSKLTTRLDLLERTVKNSNISIDTTKFLTEDSLRAFLNQFLQSFLHTIEIALDSVREGAGISHYKIHTFRNKTNFLDNLSIKGNIFAKDDDTFEIGSVTEHWHKAWLTLLSVNGSITIETDLGGDIGDSTNSFGTLFANGALLKGLTPSRVVFTDSASNLFADKIDLTDSLNTIVNELQVFNGGTGASTSAGARANLDVYSTSEVDALLAGKATAGASTSVDSGHSHTQN